jgi:hypothetical protein
MAQQIEAGQELIHGLPSDRFSQAQALKRVLVQLKQLASVHNKDSTRLRYQMNRRRAWRTRAN